MLPATASIRVHTYMQQHVTSTRYRGHGHQVKAVYIKNLQACLKAGLQLFQHLSFDISHLCDQDC